MMRHSVAERLKGSHRLGEVLPHDRAIWESETKPVAPKLLVGLTEETGLEAERNAGYDATAGDLLAFFEPFHGDDHVLDAVRLKDIEVHEPRMADWCLRLAHPKLSIHRIAKQNLEAVDCREACGGQVQMPLVDRYCMLMVASRRIEEGLKSLIGKPLSCLLLVHDRLSYMRRPGTA